MPACRRCGSIDTRDADATALDRVLTFVLGRPSRLCRRCGWQGRIPAVSRPRRSARAAEWDHRATDVDLTRIDRALACGSRGEESLLMAAR
jgi:hypothetical protein